MISGQWAVIKTAPDFQESNLGLCGDRPPRAYGSAPLILSWMGFSRYQDECHSDIQSESFRHHKGLNYDELRIYDDRCVIAVLTIFASMSQGAAQGQDIGQGNVQQDLASCFGAAVKPELVAPVLHESGTSECQARRTCNVIQTVHVVKTITMLCMVGKCIEIVKHRS